MIDKSEKVPAKEKTNLVEQVEKTEYHKRKIEVKPLKPTDPTGAIFKCHGHFILHLAYFIVCLAFVDKD